MLYDPKWQPKETKTAEPWRRVLLAAADIIEQRGHATGCFEDGEGRVCMVGALQHAAYWSGLIQPYDKRDTYISAQTKIEIYVGEHVPHWNDRHTGPEAIAALRAAAASD